MRIFFTGATGFVGSHIAKALADRHEIVAPTRHPQEGLHELGANSRNIRLVKWQPDELDRLLQDHRPDMVINLIGIIKEKPKQGVTFEEVHFEFTRKLVDAAKKAGVQKFIQMSAVGAKKHSKSRYLSTKAWAENYLQESSLRYTIFRPSIILGKGQKMFSDFAQLKKLAPFFPAPNAQVQPIHIDDVRDAFAKAVEEDHTGKTYELCGPEQMKFERLFRFVNEQIGAKKPVFTAPNAFFRLSLPLMKLLPQQPLTRDQFYMFQEDNICRGNNGAKELLGRLRDPFSI